MQVFYAEKRIYVYSNTNIKMDNFWMLTYISFRPRNCHTRLQQAHLLEEKREKWSERKGEVRRKGRLLWWREWELTNLFLIKRDRNGERRSWGKNQNHFSWKTMEKERGGVEWWIVNHFNFLATWHCPLQANQSCETRLVPALGKIISFSPHWWVSLHWTHVEIWAPFCFYSILFWGLLIISLMSYNHSSYPGDTAFLRIILSF